MRALAIGLAALAVCAAALPAIQFRAENVLDKDEYSRSRAVFRSVAPWEWSAADLMETVRVPYVESAHAMLEKEAGLAHWPFLDSCSLYRYADPTVRTMMETRVDRGVFVAADCGAMHVRDMLLRGHNADAVIAAIDNLVAQNLLVLPNYTLDGYFADVNHQWTEHDFDVSSYILMRSAYLAK